MTLRNCVPCLCGNIDLAAPGAQQPATRGRLLRRPGCSVVLRWQWLGAFECQPMAFRVMSGRYTITQCGYESMYV